jgi:hypothetical protein
MTPDNTSTKHTRIIRLLTPRNLASWSHAILGFAEGARREYKVDAWLYILRPSFRNLCLPTCAPWYVYFVYIYLGCNLLKLDKFDEGRRAQHKHSPDDGFAGVMALPEARNSWSLRGIFDSDRVKQLWDSWSAKEKKAASAAAKGETSSTSSAGPGSRKRVAENHSSGKRLKRESAEE